jgi:DNA-binding transcriptional regulator YiaG
MSARLISSGTKVTRKEKAGDEIQSESDGARIRALRKTLHLTQEAFARECGVQRIAALLWENGKSAPSPPAWRKMARLASKAAPSTALWFWEKSGTDRDAYQDMFPELARLARESEKRIAKIVKDAGSEFIPVPVMQPSLEAHGSGLAYPEVGGTEEWISVPKAVVRDPDAYVAYAFRISPLFVRPTFSLGDIIVIDPSQDDILNLEGLLVAAIYVPDAETIAAAESVRRGLPIAEYMRGKWPHLEKGVYVGWLKTDPPVAGARVRQMNLNSAKFVTAQPVSAGLEFSVPIAMIDEPKPGEKLNVQISEAKVLGRVVSWMAAGPDTPRDESAA